MKAIDVDLGGNSGRLGDADLERIRRSRDQSALLVGDRLLVLGRAAAATAIRSLVSLLPYSTTFWTAASAKNFASQRHGVVIVDGRLDEAATARLRAGTWEGREP